MDIEAQHPRAFIASLSERSPDRSSLPNQGVDLKTSFYVSMTSALERIWSDMLEDFPFEVTIDPQSSLMDAVRASNLPRVGDLLRRYLLRELFWRFEEGVRALPSDEIQALNAMTVAHRNLHEIRFLTLGSAGVRTALDFNAWAIMTPLTALFSARDVPWVAEALRDPERLEELSRGFFQIVQFLSTEHMEVLAAFDKHLPKAIVGDSELLIEESSSFLRELEATEYRTPRLGCPAQIARLTSGEEGTVSTSFNSWFHGNVARQIWRLIAEEESQRRG